MGNEIQILEIMENEGLEMGTKEKGNDKRINNGKERNMVKMEDEIKVLEILEKMKVWKWKHRKEEKIKKSS